MGRLAHRCLTVTAALAGITFCAVVGAGMQKFGMGGFFKGLVRTWSCPRYRDPLMPMIFIIELVGLLIRHVVLAVRLLANMFAGHLVLAVILGSSPWANPFSFAWVGITTVSVLGSAALTLLELFVAFLRPIYSRFCQHYSSAWQSIPTKVEVVPPKKPFQRR